MAYQGIQRREDGSLTQQYSLRSVHNHTHPVLHDENLDALTLELVLHGSKQDPYQSYCSQALQQKPLAHYTITRILLQHSFLNSLSPLCALSLLHHRIFQASTQPTSRA
jgi:hypothetical protein